MTPNVKKALRAWDMVSEVGKLPGWALKRASEVIEQTVPEGDVLFPMPAGLKIRLTVDIAKALVEERKRNFQVEDFC